MDTRLLSIVGLLLVIFIAAMLANSGIVGYSATGSLKEYPYEGFAEIKERFDARDENEKKQYAGADAFSLLDGSKAPIENFDTDGYKKVVMGGYNKVAKAFRSKAPMTTIAGAEAFGPMNTTTSLPSTPEDESPALKVVGFKGVQSGAYGDEKIIGFMYNNESNTSCKPYGYTNSKGNICLSPEDIRMLTTRGGNALGASDQIGK